MRVLVTGADGVVGRALRDGPQAIEVIACARSEFDLTEPDRMAAIVAAEEPDVIVNAAAYTAVDRAELEPDRAAAVNATGVAALAEICRRHDVRLIHLSTDCVFDGTAERAYRPDDPTGPVSVYGRTKLAGERFVLDASGLRGHVVRTAWVYGPAGRSFVSLMLGLFARQPVVRVVTDQVGPPTSSASLARCLWRLVETPAAARLLHYTDEGAVSRYEFAIAILEEARAIGIVDDTVTVLPIRTCEFPTAAKRPAFSVLDTSATVEQLHIAPLPWRDELRRVLAEMAQ